MATTKRKASKKQAKAETPNQFPDIPLEFVLPPDLPMLYVDNLNVVHTPSEFIISFMQAQPPLLKGDTQWNEVSSIKSVCVARLVVSPLKMELVVRTLAANFQKYVQSYVQQEVGDGNDNTQTDGDTSAT